MTNNVAHIDVLHAHIQNGACQLIKYKLLYMKQYVDLRHTMESLGQTPKIPKKKKLLVRVGGSRSQSAQFASQYDLIENLY